MLDENYYCIVEDILENDEFNKLETIEHHGTNRLTHSKRVSYYSYEICKKLHIDYIAAARAGLLHDFFISENERTKHNRMPYVSCKYNITKIFRKLDCKYNRQSSWNI